MKSDLSLGRSILKPATAVGFACIDPITGFAFANPNGKFEIKHA